LNSSLLPNIPSHPPTSLIPPERSCCFLLHVNTANVCKK
jgi:hypothetical protein